MFTNIVIDFPTEFVTLFPNLIATPSPILLFFRTLAHLDIVLDIGIVTVELIVTLIHRIEVFLIVFFFLGLTQASLFFLSLMLASLFFLSLMLTSLFFLSFTLTSLFFLSFFLLLLLTFEFL